jgi:hypothetical protein
MTPRPAGGAKHRRARARGHARAPDTVHVSPPLPSASRKRNAPEALAPGGCTHQPPRRKPAEHNGAQPRDMYSPPQQPLPPGLQFSEDILSNKHNMLTGLMKLILVIAVAMVVPVALVYLVVHHAPEPAKVSIVSGAFVVIATGGKVILGQTWQKWRKRCKRPISEKPEGDGAAPGGSGGPGK